MKKLHLIMISILVMVCFVGFVSASYAVEEITIGAVYPLTGALGPAGAEFYQGVLLAAEFVNNKFEGIDLPFAETEGLPNLGGAKIKIVVADHEGSPEKALSSAERLISQDNVVALIGGYSSSCAATASQAAERQQIPYIGSEVSSPQLTERGFNWFFRVNAHDGIFIKAFFEFLDDLKEKKGEDIKTVAIFCEDSLFGADVADLTEVLAEEYGYEVVSKVLIPTGTTDLSSEVQQLKAAKPDVLISGTYVSDQILFMNTAKELDFNVGGMLNSSGWVDAPEILPILQEVADFAITRAIWAADISDKKPAMGAVNQLYRDKYGVDMIGAEWSFQAAHVLFMAINEAGTTENVAIQKALRNLDLSSDEIVMPWAGISFDEKGQNNQAIPIMLQVKDMEYHTIWPFELASRDVVWPMPKWSDR